MILPGLGNNSADYSAVAADLQGRGVPVEVAKVTRLDWYVLLHGTPISTLLIAHCCAVVVEHIEHVVVDATQQAWEPTDMGAQAWALGNRARNAARTDGSELLEGNFATPACCRLVSYILCRVSSDLQQEA